MAGDDDREDDWSSVHKIFASLFGGEQDHYRDMTRQIDEMMAQMNDMFKNGGDAGFSVGFHPPPPSRNGLPPHGPYQMSPRDTMLKNPDDVPSSAAPSLSNDAPSLAKIASDECQTCDIPSQPIISLEDHPPRDRQRFVIFPSFFGGGPGFRSPFGTEPADTASGMVVQPSSNTDGEMWSTTSSSSSRTQFNTGSGWSGKQIRTVRRSDGSVEKIEKVTENGRTCTTVTCTDPQGVTTSNTTCDLPAIGAGSSPETPGTSYLTPEPGMTEQDTGFFNKLFGFNVFKPKKDDE